MASLSVQPQAIAGLFTMAQDRFEDARGFFARIYCEDRFHFTGQGRPQQIDYSHTIGRGSVRGIHFQHPPFAQAKIITCLSGEILDVAVDLRAGSKTFLQWHGEKLSGHSLNSIVIPEGVAHGFQVLSDEAHLLYLQSSSYQPQAEGRVHPLDPVLKIDWPLEVLNLSPRDAAASFLSPDWMGLTMA